MTREEALAEIALAATEQRRANLYGAYLQDATLTGATLTGATLTGATLTDANLYKANLQGALVKDTKWPSPTMVLLAHWHDCSDALTIQLMRYDAACHGEPALFDAWAAGGPCPYLNLHYQRACNFLENRKLYSAGPSLSALVLMQMLLAEKCKLG